MHFFQVFLNSGLFIDEIRHGAVSLIFCIFLYRKTKKVSLSLLPLLITYLIDSDHLIDYYMYYGFKMFNPVDFIRMDYFKYGQAFVFFHAWEWVFALLYFAWRKKSWTSWQLILATGMISHMIWDSHTVGSPIPYFILYRVVHGFVVV